MEPMIKVTSIRAKIADWSDRVVAANGWATVSCRCGVLGSSQRGELKCFSSMRQAGSTA